MPATLDLIPGAIAFDTNTKIDDASSFDFTSLPDDDDLRKVKVLVGEFPQMPTREAIQAMSNTTRDKLLRVLPQLRNFARFGLNMDADSESLFASMDEALSSVERLEPADQMETRLLTALSLLRYIESKVIPIILEQRSAMKLRLYQPADQVTTSSAELAMAVAG
jgi:Mg/Co/Ni transporter MgtE